jgi:hypothetical protein
VEISNTLQKHPIQELERRVNALEEAIKMEVCSANLAGCQALNKVLGACIPTILLHRRRSFDDIPGLLAVPTPEPTSLDTKAAFESIREAEIEQDQRILEEVERRFLGGVSVTTEPGSVENQPSYRHILARAHEVVSRAKGARLRVDPNATIGTNSVPMTVIDTRI